MNYCPRCGARLGPDQNFCGNCGLDLRRLQFDQAEASQATPARGLWRNTVVYLTRDGVQGVVVRSMGVLALAAVSALFLAALIYYETQAFALAVYIALWIATSGLLYDELRWRGVRGLGDVPPQKGGGRKLWLVPWQSVRMADWNGRTLWFTSSSPTHKVSATFNKEDAPLVERTLASNGIRYSRGAPRLPSAFTRFSTLALLMFIIGQAILILAALLPYFPGEQQLYTTIYNHTKDQIAGATFVGEFAAIFLNNIQVAWGGSIPFLGALTYGLANYNTGRVIQAIATLNTNPITNAPQPLPPYVVLVALYVLPHTWIEESAYPIATVAGTLALTKWRSMSPAEFVRRRNWGSARLLLALGGTAVILLVAGLVETATSYVGDGIVALWVPIALLYFVSRRRWKRRVGTEPAAGSP